ncbi:MAG: helix-turn-helix domain-containing protein [Clostridiales bacterium]|nr:helix-turn-helix domain-containing protein [Clostridiales bacterium]
MNRRIKLVLLDSKLTQVEFAKRIGISRTGVQKLISGENNPREQTIRAICSEFNVRRAWLETGEGEMRITPASDGDMKLKDRIKDVRKSLGLNQFNFMLKLVLLVAQFH